MNSAQQQKKKSEHPKSNDQKDQSTPAKSKIDQKKGTPKVVKNPLMRSNPDPLSRKPKQQPIVKSQVKPQKVSEDKQKLLQKEKKQMQPQKQQKKQFDRNQLKQKPAQTSKEAKICEQKSISQNLFTEDATHNTAKPSQKKEKVEVDSQKSIIKREVQESKKDLKDLVSEMRQPEIKHKIKAKIVDSVVKGTTLSKYTLYQLQGSDNHGPFRIQRKLTQFSALRKSLRERWPGVFIPSLSFKSQLKNSQEKQLEIKAILEHFIIGLSYSQFLYYREEVQLFLRSQQIDIQKVTLKIFQFTEQMPILKAPDIIDRYRSCFPQDLFQSKNDTKPVIKQFVGSLQKTIPSLKQICSKGLLLSQTYNAYSLSLQKWIQFSRTYQLHILSYYTNNKREKTIVTKDEGNSIDILKQLSKKNPFFNLYQFVSLQLKDAQAFLQTILSCDQFIAKCQQLKQNIRQLEEEVNQINQGKSTIKTVTSRKSNQDILVQLQAKVKKLRKDQYIINQIFTISSSLLVNVTINTFKTFQRQAYQLMLIEWNQITSGLHPQIEALWKSIQAESKALLK